MVEMIVKANQISLEDQNTLRNAIEMRNRAVHDLREPERASAQKMYKDVVDFIKRKTLKPQFYDPQKI